MPKQNEEDLVQIPPHRVFRYQRDFLDKYAKKNKVKKAVALRHIIDNFIQQHE